MNKSFRFFISSMFGLSLLFLTAPPGFPYPPQSIDLQYDAAGQQLLVNVAHISRHKNNQFIKKIEVVKNNGTPVVQEYRQQVDPNNFTTKIPLSAEKGDVIKVTAYAQEGGSAEATLSITEDLLKGTVTAFPEPSRAIAPHPSDPDKLNDAVPADPKISKPTFPEDPDKIRPAVTRDPAVAKAAVPQDPKISKPAVPTDPTITKPAAPQYSDSLKPATPDSR